jgi:hypothetical protein
MTMKRWLLFTLAAIFLLSMSGMSLGNQGDLRLPYTGVIQNKTNHDISVPSLNSGATLIVPARGWIEYQAWEPSFEIIGYFNGKPECCQKVQVNPKGYQFMCQTYDFEATICPVEEMTVIEKYRPSGKLKKRIRKRRSPVKLQEKG